MSYEDEGGGDDGEDRGRLVAIASFFTVHEAELARTKLESEGLVAVLWDAATVNADPLLALALRGVKVAVPERDALRARAILGPLAEVVGRARPAFRVKGNHGTSGMLVGALVGVGIAVALSRVVGGALPWIAGVVVAVVGSWWGERRRADTCSSCLHPVRPVGAASAAHEDRCPRCDALLRGTIAHVNDRLAAEEALEDDGAKAELGDDDDVEDASIPTDGACHDATDGTASRG